MGEIITFWMREWLPTIFFLLQAKPLFSSTFFLRPFSYRETLEFIQKKRRKIKKKIKKVFMRLCITTQWFGYYELQVGGPRMDVQIRMEPFNLVRSRSGSVSEAYEEDPDPDQDPRIRFWWLRIRIRIHMRSRATKSNLYEGVWKQDNLQANSDEQMHHFCPNMISETCIING